LDIREAAQIIRKRWLIAAIGVVLAIALGIAAYAARAGSQYTSTTTLFVTQPGFPFTGPSTSANGSSVDPGQLSNFAYLYAQLAESDAIRLSIGAPPNTINATVITSGAFSTGNALPFIDITGVGQTAAGAQARSKAATRALQQYIRAGQAAANTPHSQRVQLRVINAAEPGKPIAARTRAVILPGVVFMTVILLTLGLIFMLENLSRPAQPARGEVQVEERSRRSPSWADLPVEQVESGSSGRGGLLRRQ
jgi:hypothetical protein